MFIAVFNCICRHLLAYLGKKFPLVLLTYWKFLVTTHDEINKLMTNSRETFAIKWSISTRHVENILYMSSAVHGVVPLLT